MLNIAPMDSFGSRGGIEGRLIALEYQLREVEYRVRTDLRTRELAWLKRFSSGMSLLCRMMVEAVRPSSSPSGTPATALLPELQPRAVSVNDFREHTPEKLELVEGFLIDGAQYPEARRRLLGLLLVNVGLLETIRLAPAERWRDALQHLSEGG
jgi:hypothetical protein